MKSWLENLKQHAESDNVIMLVGNKLDIVQTDGENAREVPTDAAKYFAQQEGLMFTEASAKSNHNVRDAFENLL